LTDPLDELRSIAGPVSRETLERVRRFAGEFERWSGRMNLAAASQHDSLWRRHVLDSAQLIPLAGGARRWLDLGSGGGFPGAILAIVLAERPGAQVDLIESNRKKAAFLATALADCPTATVHARRIEAVAASVSQPDIVTARAVAPLHSLLALAQPWVSSGARGLFHKGRGYRRELDDARDAWRFDLVEHRSMIDPEGVILDITGLKRS
jgi:16S rRNA (guanine527-N7)-methyltransferase